MKKAYFVTGIDTDAGKSYATGILAAAWMSDGIKVITQKFIQTGCEDDSISEDIITHRRIMGTGLLPEDFDNTTCPVRFQYPASPDLAARLENRVIDLSVIDGSTEKLLLKYDKVLIEGAGGLMVPVTGSYTSLDYVRERGLPLVVVTNPQLGSINHTLLTLEACRAHGVKPEIILFNHYPETSEIITDDTRKYIRRYLNRTFPECEFIEIPYVNI